MKNDKNDNVNFNGQQLGGLKELLSMEDALKHG